MSLTQADARTGPGAATHPAPHGARLALRGVRLGHSGNAVLDGVDLTVEPGEVLAVVGPSGCGKSTLLRTLAGLLPPLDGVVEQDGAPVRGPDADRALVFQDDALLPWRTVRANVELPLAVARSWGPPEEQGAGRPSDGSGPDGQDAVPGRGRRSAVFGLSRAARRARRRIADQWLERVGLEEHAHKFPHQLSGGQRQRVQLARALAARPRAVLMDEPFGALDAQTRAEMQDLLVDVLKGTGASVVFVTHDVDEALFLGDRVALLAAARVVPVPRPRDRVASNAGLRQQIINSL
ncbi:NitT/TauT family transport system ATP-binding protein [Streptomyces sp. CG 926]|uniref:ABC transporter ATP-binding protein n=1 Tax=Streptomyces sp. CG 926 TaxID=1882405 RepID=UPI000D79BF08|nr:ABC transporter ATP-binding protein [Streptomyces sp. CG 926]PWK73130.1 NitT/TauT family transport system ATP-binding protein [Streptomyces sp. CG 926]